MKGQRSDTRAAILRSAARLFVSRGYPGTSINDIASSLGISKPAVYHYFRSKADILNEIYGTAANAIVGRIDTHGADWAERRLRQTMYEVMDVIRDTPAEVTVFYQEGPLLDRNLPRRQARELRAMEKRFTDYVTGSLKDSMDAGVIRRIDPALTAFAFIAMVAWASRWYRPGMRASASEIAELFFSIGMDGARGAV
jgi:TetR/AcrR family transcriptional regulator, cholesterol catabolism regulator